MPVQLMFTCSVLNIGYLAFFWRELTTHKTTISMTPTITTGIHHILNLLNETGLRRIIDVKNRGYKLSVTSIFA